jgi:hypothetical protein
MALDMFSIPAMSAEPERVFSGSKITISDRRCSLLKTILPDPRKTAGVGIIKCLCSVRVRTMAPDHLGVYDIVQSSNHLEQF